MNEYEANLDVNTKKQLYLGIAFVTLNSQMDMYTLTTI